jgi:hypothetical protein
MGLLKWIVEKIVVYGLVFTFFYIIGQSLGIVPQPLKDFINWFASNFPLIAIMVTVMIICYTALKLSLRRGETNE